MSLLRRIWQKRGGFLLDVLPALLYCGVLFWAGLIPLKSLPGPDFEAADKVWHAVAFGGLAGLGCRALKHAGRAPLLAARDSALAAVLLGGLLELLQSFTAYRSADPLDFIADAVGAAVAYALLRTLEGVAAEGAAR
ncbi:MAG TPA: VanZ family protein [Polyangiaceae bacterium]|nr:VanZ family protein [Polyangiaceae bacterium]